MRARSSTAVGFAFDAPEMKTPTQRISIGIEIQSSTAGSSSTGCYTTNGALSPTSDVGTPVKLCSDDNGKLDCNL